ncbi:MAG: hypothetical protein AAB501_01095 [Patescibacteria group bacterium]
MLKTSNGKNHVVGEVLYLEIMGHDFVKSALTLFNTKETTREHSGYVYSFNLLASQALEILPKSIIATRICLKENNKPIEEIRNAISKELSCLGHKLDNIFNEVQELKKILGISAINRVNSADFVDEFRFTVSGKIIAFKNLEGARYGAFAKNKNFSSNYDINASNFLKNLSEKTAEIRVNMINAFDNKKK